SPADPSTCSRYSLSHDTPTTAISTLSLHDALPIYGGEGRRGLRAEVPGLPRRQGRGPAQRSPRRRPGDAGEQDAGAHDQQLLAPDRKSTRLNSSHQIISYAVFCLKKKNNRI